MRQPFRAVISDLDGTLLNGDHRLGELTISILEQLAENGVEIFLATGRSFADVKHIISKVNIQHATLVTSNGARATDLNGKQFTQHHIPSELALEIMQNTPFDPNAVCLNSYQGEQWFINKDIEQLKKYHQDSGFMYEVVDFKQHHGEQTEKIFYIAKEPADLLPIEQFIQTHYGDKLQTTYSTPQCFEMMLRGVNKANTLAELIAMRGYSMADCIAFGDGMNDVEMLAQVGKGCVMGNADPRLKQALPNNEVIGVNQDEAVARFLCDIFKLNNH